MEHRVRAVIIDRTKILSIKRVLSDRTFWVVPGGGVEKEDEDFGHALRRECLEEINVEVEIGNLIWQRSFRDQIELFYLAKIIRGQVGKGCGPEYVEANQYYGTHEPEWIEIEQLKNIIFYPEPLKEVILQVYGKSNNKNNIRWEDIDWSPLSRQDQ